MMENIDTNAGKYMWHKSRARPIERIDIFTGEVKEYFSLASIAQDGFRLDSVSNVCSGVTNKYKGYYWQYLDQEQGVPIAAAA